MMDSERLLYYRTYICPYYYNVDCPAACPYHTTRGLPSDDASPSDARPAIQCPRVCTVTRYEEEMIRETQRYNPRGSARWHDTRIP